jgi:hypothetical protein
VIGSDTVRVGTVNMHAAQTATIAHGVPRFNPVMVVPFLLWVLG